MSQTGQSGTARSFAPRDGSGAQFGGQGEPGGPGGGGKRSLRWVIFTVGVVAVLGAGGYFLRGYLPGGSDASKGKAAISAPPRLIRVGTVEEKAIPVQVEAVGSVEPLRTVAIRSRVDGHVTEIRVKPGDLVQAGQVMFVLDQRPFRATLDQAQATVSRDQASFANAKEEADRQVQLMDKQLTTQEAFDRSKTALEVAKQAVEVSRAAVEGAKLNLEFATIRAPITGRIGKPLIDIGSIVRGSDSTAIVTINQTHPIYATFSVPQRYLTEIRDRFGKDPLRVVVRIPGSNAKSAPGLLTFVDNTVDTTTGTIVLRATCENPGEILWPGESVSVTLILTTEANAKVIPPEAIQTGPRGTFVYVAKDDNTVEYRPIKLDRVVGSTAVIAEGLSVNEKVVLDGQLNLINGARIQVVAANTEPAKKP